MNATISPTILAEDAAAYQQQIETVSQFAARLHIDIADGSLAPTHTVGIDEIWWPGGVRADLHCMIKQPLEHLEALIALQPQLIIVHAEGQGNFADFADACHHHGIETGIALLQQTPVDTIRPALDLIDHVLVFSGDFGKFGGKADPAMLTKVKALKALKPQLEIGWDGGINAQNINALARSGVEVLNVGGAIHGTDDPAAAYERLQTALHTAPRPRPAATAPATPEAPSTPAVKQTASAPAPAVKQAIVQHPVHRGRASSVPVRRVAIDQRG